MTTQAMNQEQVNAFGIQRLFDNGAFVVEACAEVIDAGTAKIVFFIDDMTGKNIAQASDFREARKIAKRMTANSVIPA
tara:strand:- start:593 stop:826 length:234 start_codon:yes stop_codon:yes gene_type:complete